MSFHPSVVGGTMKKIFKTSHAEVAQLIPSSKSSRCPGCVSVHFWTSVARTSDTDLEDRVLFHMHFVDSPN